MQRTQEALYALIEARRTELGLSQAQLSLRAFGKSDSSPIQNLKRGSSPSYERLGALADALELELYFGPRRESGPIEHVRLDSKDYAHIPLHQALLAAGAGAHNDADTVIDHIAFRRDWLKNIGVTASSARLARVDGDSMQPTLFDDDLILVDTKAEPPRPRIRESRDRRRSPIYALIDDGQARVKRIERPSDEQMMLISDNPDYPPELRQGKDIQSIKIIGKVVWWGHRAKE